MRRRENDVIPLETTLPDLVREGLDIVFVGINPSVYSARQGHYFARPTNRFWPAFSRSILSAAARQGLGIAMLRPEHDAALLDYGFGFTDVVKRPTGNAAQLAPGELAAAVPLLLAKIEACRPRLACFHGITGYRPFHRVVFPDAAHQPVLGLQAENLGATRLAVVPNPSPANAHATPADQTAWYDRLAGLVAETRPRA
jgi:double-stranded uracil-DNA glycosylase